MIEGSSAANMTRQTGRGQEREEKDRKKSVSILNFVKVVKNDTGPWWSSGLTR